MKGIHLVVSLVQEEKSLKIMSNFNFIHYKNLKILFASQLSNLEIELKFKMIKYITTTSSGMFSTDTLFKQILY